MSRLPAALALAFAPLLALAVLLARARQSWQTCIDGNPAGLWPAFNLEIIAALHPINLIVMAGFPALALIWALRPAPRKTLAIWAVYSALILVPMLSPDALHHCDRKGVNSEMLYVLAPLLGLLACWLALWHREKPQ